MGEKKFVLFIEIKEKPSCATRDPNILNNRSIEWYEANFPKRYKWHTATNDRVREKKTTTSRTEGEGREK